MKKILVGLGVCLIFVFAFLADARERNDHLVIGSILPLSGDLAALGQEVQRGMDIAAEGTPNIMLVHEDDGSLDARAGVQAANKLLNIDKIDVGVTMLVDQALPIGPQFQEASTPLLVVWDDSERLADVGDMMIGLGFSVEKTAEKMAQFAYNELQLRDVAILAHQEAYALISMHVFSEVFTNLGGRITQEEALQTTEVDYRAVLTEMNQTKQDGWYLPLFPSTNLSVFQQMEELGIEGRRMTIDGLIQDIILEAPELFEGTYYTNYYADDTDRLKERYREMYGEEPLDIALVSFGFDAINQIIAAAEIDGGDLGEAIRRKLPADKVERIYRIESAHPVLAG